MPRGRRKDAYQGELHELIVNMYMAGHMNSVIADKLFIGDTTVDNHIKYAKGAGEIPKNFKKKTIYDPNYKRKPRGPRAKKVNKSFVQSKSQKLPEKPDGITVNCTRSVSKKCVYGTNGQTNDSALCNYILCEGRRRGCPHTACNKFSRVTADNPKRSSII